VVWESLYTLRETLPQLRLAPGEVSSNISFIEEEFSKVGRQCSSFRLGGTFHRTYKHLGEHNLYNCASLLDTILEIGFRLVTPHNGEPAARLDHTSHHDQMLDTAFWSRNDEVIADAVFVWAVDGDQAPPGSFARHLVARMERDTPFSPRLRRTSIQAIERVWRSELEASGLETVRLLNCLDVDVGDMVKKDVWVQLLVGAICLPTGLENLSSHYWHLLEKLESAVDFRQIPRLRPLKVMRSLEKAEDWERLEVWMVFVWHFADYDMLTSTMEGVEQVTLKLLLQRASALPRFRDLQASPHRLCYRLRWICDQAQAERLPLEPPPPPYVSVHPVRIYSC
jgi:hypothetical protein